MYHEIIDTCIACTRQINDPLPITFMATGYLVKTLEYNMYNVYNPKRTCNHVHKFYKMIKMYKIAIFYLCVVQVLYNNYVFFTCSIFHLAYAPGLIWIIVCICRCILFKSWIVLTCFRFVTTLMVVSMLWRRFASVATVRWWPVSLEKWSYYLRWTTRMSSGLCVCLRLFPWSSSKCLWNVHWLYTCDKNSC